MRPAATGFTCSGGSKWRMAIFRRPGQAFDKALAVQPDDAELWVDIGRLRYRGGEQSQAVDASIKALAINPDDAEALRFRAQLLRDAEGLAAALPLFERALKQHPDNVPLLLDYAATLGDLGRATDMLVAVRKVAVLDPGNREIYYLQAVLAARGGRFDLAQNLLLRADRAQRETPAAMLLSGIVDIELGNDASAAQTLDRLVTMQPDNARARVMLARALSLGRNDRELVYRFGKAALRPGAAPYLSALVARSFEALDQRSDAANVLDLSAQPAPDALVGLPAPSTLAVAEARGPQSGADALALVRALIDSRRAPAAITVADAFLGKFPGSGDALVLAGDARLAARDLTGAVRDYAEAARIRRPWPLTRKYARALVALNHPQQAWQLVAAHAAGEPANVEAAGLLAGYWASQSRWDIAAAYADQALAQGGGRDPALLALRARIALAQGDQAGAVDYAEGAFALQRTSPAAIGAMIEVYRRIPDAAPVVRALSARQGAGPGHTSPG